MKIVRITYTLLFLAAFSFLSAQNKTVFPLKISPNKRHLVDQKGQPFLYVSDSGWLLFFGLTLSDAREYMRKRKEQGFTVIHVMLSGLAASKTLKGDAPFTNHDFSKPNEKFFAAVEPYFALADSFNLALMVAPLWYSCCNDGWGSHPEAYMQKNGAKKCYNFGQYVGKRFGKYKNVLWLMGGDNDPHDNREAVRQLALGIKSADPFKLMTYHAASTHSSTDVWDNEKWLDFSMVYTYFRGFPKAWNRVQPDVYEVCYAEYRKKPLMPYLLGESTYEGEHEAMGSPLQARKQAYWAMLSGACGHSYGSPFWQCEPTWRKQVVRQGAISLKHLSDLFRSFDWTQLVPQTNAKPDEKGFGENDFATEACTADGKMSVTYIPSKRSVVCDLDKLKGEMVDVIQFNPRTGDKKTLTTVKKLLPNQKYTYQTPDNEDWVLILKVK